MAIVADYIRQLGFKFGIYSSDGVGACDGAYGTSEGYERQDAELFVREWRAEYVMIDSCGIINKPPPFGPPPGFVGGQGRWELDQWHNNLAAEQAAGAKPVALHDCHVGCASNYGGPTLAVSPCNAKDPAQQWAVDVSGTSSNYTSLVNQKLGFCAGCGSNPMDGCGNSARIYPNGTSTGAGLGLQACLTGHTNQGAPTAPSQQLRAIGTAAQLFNISANGKKCARLEAHPSGLREL